MKSFTTQINQGGNILFYTCGTEWDTFRYGIKSIDVTAGASVLIEAKTFDYKGDWHTIAGIDVEWNGDNFCDNIEALDNLLDTEGAVRFEATVFLAK